MDSVLVRRRAGLGCGNLFPLCHSMGKAREFHLAQNLMNSPNNFVCCGHSCAGRSPEQVTSSQVLSGAPGMPIPEGKPGRDTSDMNRAELLPPERPP